MRPTKTCAILLLLLGPIATPGSMSMPNSVLMSQEPASPTVAKSQRWLLLCCGLPGDDAHRDRLTEACEKIIAASQSVLDVSPDRLSVLAGDETMRDALADQALSIDVCTKETVSEEMQRLCKQVDADDACWVILLGHAHLYDARSQFNVLDVDFDQSEFAVWARELKCREQVFWITMPASGFWIKPLRSESRVVISATEADLEVTGTEMPYALADLLAGDGETETLEDVDHDGSLSLLDLYVASNREIFERFRTIDRLQTEHAQLDDNGDGRGSEVQFAYLPEEDDEDEENKDQQDLEEPDRDDEAGEDPKATQAISRKVPEPISNVNLDGYLSRHILINAAADDSGDDKTNDSVDDDATGGSGDAVAQADASQGDPLPKGEDDKGDEGDDDISEATP